MGPKQPLRLDQYLLHTMMIILLHCQIEYHDAIKILSSVLAVQSYAILRIPCVGKSNT